MDNYFLKDDKTSIPFSLDKYLLPMLSPTSPGTNYWDSKPSSEISENQLGRIVLQIHQILDLFKSLGVSLSNKSFLDIGTGNGMIPKILLEFTELKEAVGSDPYLDGEHKTSWQKHNHKDTFNKIKSFIKSHCNNELNFENYFKVSKNENSTFIPQIIRIIDNANVNKSYIFKKFGIHDLHKINKKFDLLYCKAIEHISDWDSAFKVVSKVAKDKSYFYLKHRSFYSYLGPHRYSSIEIPWGHLLLTDSEYIRFIGENHNNRKVLMKKFYFNDLTYPRKSISDMIIIANKYGFHMHGIKIEPPRYKDMIFNFANEIPNFWKIIKSNHPNVSSEEILSGMIHIVFKKNL